MYCTLSPDWKLSHVKAFTIQAETGTPEKASFGRLHPGDLAQRRRLDEWIRPAESIYWMHQVHGETVLELPLAFSSELEADGAFTKQKNTVCAVITADCLPIVFTDLTGSRVGVVHAGRKGLQNEIIAAMVRRLEVPSNEILAWIGPGIAAKSYPVSPEIRQEFLAISTNYERVFTQVNAETFLMDLYAVAELQLQVLGLSPDHISGAAWDTFSDTRFHSARRDKEASGRMATLVWME